MCQLGRSDGHRLVAEIGFGDDLPREISPILLAKLRNNMAGNIFLFTWGDFAILTIHVHTQNLSSPPTATTQKHHLHVPRPPPRAALLIPLCLLPQAHLSRRQPLPYDPTPSFCSPLCLSLRILFPLAPANPELRCRRFNDCNPPLQRLRLPPLCLLRAAVRFPRPLHVIQR